MALVSASGVPGAARSGATVGVLLLPNGGARFSSLSFPASGGALASLAPGAKLSIVRSSRSAADSPAEVVHALGLAVPGGRWGLLPAAKIRVPSVDSARTSVGSPSEDEDMIEGRGVLSLSVPEGTKIWWGSIPAAANCNTQGQVARSSTNPSAVTFGEDFTASRGTKACWVSPVHCSGTPSPFTFAEEFALLLDEIPLQMNCVALVGHQDVLDDIADSAARTILVIREFTPFLLETVSDRVSVDYFPRSEFPPLQKTSALDLAKAVETVRAESTEGYIREESLVKAILMVRGSAFLPKVDMLPQPYAGAVPSSSKTDRLVYFKGLASEFRETCNVLELALIQQRKA